MSLANYWLSLELKLYFRSKIKIDIPYMPILDPLGTLT